MLVAVVLLQLCVSWHLCLADRAILGALHLIHALVLLRATLLHRRLLRRIFLLSDFLRVAAHHQTVERAGLQRGHADDTVPHAAHPARLVPL